MTNDIYSDIKTYAYTVLSDASITFKQEPFIGTNNKYNYLYITINRITSKFYIGIHTSNKPFDVTYKGSGKALKQSFKKYGRDNFENFPLCYVDDRDMLSLAEAVVVNDGFIMEHSRQMYNMKSGGIEGSINRQHSSFMKMKMSDPEYKKYWKERCEFYKEHPELSKVRCGKETEEQRQLRYQQTVETNRRIFEYKKKHCPEVLQAENERRRRTMVKSLGSAVVIVDKRTGERYEFDSIKQAERFVGASILSLLRGSTKSPLYSLYDAYYCSPDVVVDKIEYKTQDYSIRMKPVNVVNASGDIVYAGKSNRDVINYLSLSENFVIKTAVEKHYCIKGYYLEYAREQDRVNCNYRPQTKNRSIIVKDTDGKFHTSYTSISQAAKQTGYSKEKIKKHINQQLELDGYIWQWIGEPHKPKHSNLPDQTKPVIGSIEKGGEACIKFDCATEASVQLGKCRSAIATACRTGYRCGGYYWRYA